MRVQQSKQLITLEALTDGIIVNFQGDRYIFPDEVAMQLAQGIATILRSRKPKSKGEAIE